MEWIKTSTKLPENGQVILGFWTPSLKTNPIGVNNYDVVIKNKRFWQDGNDNDYCAPSYWMPLPPPPKG